MKVTYISPRTSGKESMELGIDEEARRIIQIGDWISFPDEAGTRIQDRIVNRQLYFNAAFELDHIQISGDLPILIPSIRPKITEIKDTKGNDVDNNGVTPDTILKLGGTAGPNQEIEIFDVHENGTFLKGKFTAPSDGKWTMYVTDLPSGKHELSAQYTSGDRGRSYPPRKLTVEE